MYKLLSCPWALLFRKNELFQRGQRMLTGRPPNVHDVFRQYRMDARATGDFSTFLRKTFHPRYQTLDPARQAAPSRGPLQLGPPAGRLGNGRELWSIHRGEFSNHV